METKETKTGKTGSCCRLVIACIVTGLLVAAVMVAIFIPVMLHKEREAKKSKYEPTSTTSTPGEESATNKIKKGAEWLLGKRNSQWGWIKPNLQTTAEGVIAVQLARPGWCCKSADSGATINQMKIDILNGLLKNSSLDVAQWYGGKLGMYVAALSLSCNDPGDVYGYNLTAILRMHMDNFPKYNFNHMFTYSWAILGLCAASDGKIDETYVNRLLLGMKEKFTLKSTETMAMSVQALAYIKPRTNKIQNAINTGISHLRQKQKADGSFGNQFTTANVYQALIAAQALPDANEEKRIVDFLLAKVGNDGSFSSIPAAFQVLPALSRKVFSNISTYSEACISAMPTPKPTSSGTILRITIKVKYSILNNITNDMRDVTRFFDVPDNSTFYEVMVIASKQDNRYRFTAKQTKWGHSITSLSGIAASSTDRTYWSLRIAPNTPASVGVDGLRVRKNDHIAMRFTKY